MGDKAYGVFIDAGHGSPERWRRAPRSTIRRRGQYRVLDGHHFNYGCCFDYGKAEIDSRDDDYGTMETTYFGNATAGVKGTGRARGS